MATFNFTDGDNWRIRLGAIVIFSLILLLSLPSSVQGSTEYTFGDINGDGSLDVQDVAMAMRYVLQLETLNADERERADVQGNGVINVLDVILIMQRTLELIDSFPVEDLPTDTIFMVVTGENTVVGYNWQEETEITVLLDDAALSVETNEEGDFVLHQEGSEAVDFKAGQVVIVSDGKTTKSHIVRDLKLSMVDGEENLVTGTAQPGSEVHVRVHVMERDYADMPLRKPQAASSGRWTADFSVAAGSGLAAEAFNIEEGMSGEARINDLTGDGTIAYWFYEKSAFTVHPGEAITGFGWPINTTITITVEDKTYTTESDHFGFFYVAIEAAAGDEVRISDGSQTKVHVVTNLAVTSVNRSSGIITGTADAGSVVFAELLEPLGAYGPPTLLDEAEVTVSSPGVWTVNFNRQIEASHEIVVMQIDDDGDMTAINR